MGGPTGRKVVEIRNPEDWKAVLLGLREMNVRAPRKYFGAKGVP
jgi:hypothetical protein